MCTTHRFHRDLISVGKVGGWLIQPHAPGTWLSLSTVSDPTAPSLSPGTQWSQEKAPELSLEDSLALVTEVQVPPLAAAVSVHGLLSACVPLSGVTGVDGFTEMPASPSC